MPLPEQTALEEFTERAGESVSGLLVVPKLIAIDDYRRNQAAARRRVDEAHEMHKIALGMTDVGKKAGEEVTTDDMGDIIYTGDISLHPGQQVKLGKNTVIKAEQTPTETATEPTTPSAAAQPAKKSRWPALLTGAALMFGGSGLGYIINDLLKPQPAATAPAVPHTDTDTDTDTITELDFPGS